MSGPTREADFADLVDDPAPAHIARAPGGQRGPRRHARPRPASA